LLPDAAADELRVLFLPVLTRPVDLAAGVFLAVRGPEACGVFDFADARGPAGVSAPNWNPKDASLISRVLKFG
jgi:hypothetical protein